MDLKQSQQAKKYLDLFLRRKFFIAFLILLSLPVGLGVYLTTPKVYQTTSLLSYQQQKISPNKMSPDVASRINDIVSTLSQIVISRTNLEKTITDLNLYPEERKELPMEDVIEIMRKKIVIKPMKRGDVFTISFSGTSPANVVKVTNGLAAKFIEENLKYRQERASETSSYTSDELQMAKRGMDQKENAMRDYKLQYYYEMPDQREINVSRLNALQLQYQGKQESIQDLERTLVLIQDQQSSRKKLLESANTANPDPALAADTEDPQEIVSNVQRLERIELMLEQLLLRYTDKHPEVKRTRKLIVKLEKEIALEGDTGSSSVSGSPGSVNGNSRKKSLDPITLQLQNQRKNIELNIANIRREQEQLKGKIEEYEGWVASAPTREAEWSSLTREYGQLKRHYDYLVSQDLQAKSMLNLERRQKGSQFKIEDPARYPSRPIKPDFYKILGGALALGLGLGFGLTLFLDFFDTTFRDGDAVESYLGLPLISTIPYIETDKEVTKRKWYGVFSVVFLGCFFMAVLALFYYVWSKGLIVLYSLSQ